MTEKGYGLNESFENNNNYNSEQLIKTIFENEDDKTAAVNKIAKKTGTTICGLIYDGGVVLAADTRATAGSFIADKSCFKLHLLLDHIWCAGAGVAADLEHVTMRMAADLRVFQAKLKSLVRVETAVTRLCNHLVNYYGHISVALIIGGINPDSKPSLWYVSAEGHAHQLPYLAMGSGGLFASSVLERKYKNAMPEQEAVDLAADAIEAGVLNDLGSGTMVDVVKITVANPKKPTFIRGYRRPVANLPGPTSSDINMRLKNYTILSDVSKPIPMFDKNSFCDYLD